MPIRSQRGLAGPGLLAYVMVNKYSEHLPLYRQQDVLARHGIILSRSTLCGWMAQCAERLRPLYELMRKRILEADVINADETPVQVLDRMLDATRTGYFWAYISTGDMAIRSTTTATRAAARDRPRCSRASKDICRPMPTRPTTR